MKCRLLLVLLLVTPVLEAQEPALPGEEFQVNSYTTSGQFNPAVAADSQGNFFVVWSSDGSRGGDTSWDSIQAKRYDANGQALGGQFQVNSYTTNRQNTPAVAADSQGNIVVVWASRGSSWTDTDGYSVQGQRYAANGAPLGGQFQVNSYTTGDQYFWPAAATDANGNFVVVWASYGSWGTDSDYLSVQGQRYNASGTPLGGQFQVNSYTTDYQFLPDVAMDPQGNFIVVWLSFGSLGTDPSSGSIQARRYLANGSPWGGEFQVNTFTTGLQSYPSVATDQDGNFTVVWSSAGSPGTDADDTSIQGQRYVASGARLGGQFQVNTYSSSGQYYPSVAYDLEGSFVVVWDSNGSGGTDTDSYSVQGQRYEASGTPSGGQFQVNSYTTDYQSRPAVAADSQGNFVVVWESYGSYGSDRDWFSIQGRQYELALFADGFESGNTSAWSSTVP